MRTNIEIDDQLMREAMRTSRARTKRAAVEAGLRLLVEVHAQTAIRRLKGKIDCNALLGARSSGGSATLTLTSDT